MNTCYGFQNNHQLTKTYKSVVEFLLNNTDFPVFTHLSPLAFSLSNTDFPTLTHLSPLKPVSNCISVSPYNSVDDSFIKPFHKPSYISSIKPVSVVVRKCSIYNSSPGARNECVHVSVKNAICKATVTHFNECAVNIPRKVFKVLLPSLSVNTVSVPPVNVVKVTTAPTYRYTNPASTHAIVCKSVFSTSHVNTSPTPAVVI